MYDDIGVGGNDLLLGRKLGALLELEISDGAGQGEVAVNTAKVDKSAGGRDSCLLACNTRNRLAK